MNPSIHSDITLVQIESAARSFAEKHEALADIVTLLNTQVEALKAAAIKDIKRALAAAAEKQTSLVNLVEAGRHLFVSPRTVVFHGIRVGLRKGTGKLDWADDDQVVALIKKYFPDQTDALIKKTEKPFRPGLNDLETASLKKLGITLESTGDQVVVKPVDSDVDKLVSALLKDALEETSQQEALHAV